MRAVGVAQAERYVALDGLRGFAAMMVVFQHWGTAARLPHFIELGSVGVAVFFCLSGFLMGRLYLHKDSTLSNVFDFYRRRIARVVPLYAILVMTSYALLLVTGSNFPLYDVNYENLADHLMLLRGVSVMWTIPVEMQFYALFPVLWMLFCLLGRGSGFIFLLVAGAIVMIGRPNVAAVVPYAHLFLFGILVSQASRLSGRMADAVFAISLVGLILHAPIVSESLGLPSASEGWLFGRPSLLICIIGLIFSAQQSRLAGMSFGAAPLMYLGKVSFSIYLLHYPVLNALRRLEDFDIASPAYLLLYIVVTLSAASASYALVEAPMQRLVLRGWKLGRPKLPAAFPRRVPVSMAAVAIAAAVSFPLALRAGGPTSWQGYLPAEALRSVEIPASECITADPSQPAKLRNAVAIDGGWAASDNDPQIYVQVPAIDDACVTIAMSIFHWSRFEIFVPNAETRKSEFVAKRSLYRTIRPGEPSVSIVLPKGLDGLLLRIDPSDFKNEVEITGIAFGVQNAG